jgi:hypothetical protein
LAFITGFIIGGLTAWLINSYVRYLKVRRAEREIKKLLERTPHQWWSLHDFMFATDEDGTCLYRALKNLVDRGEVITEQRISSFKPPVEYKVNPDHKAGLRVPGHVGIHFKNSGKWES